LSASRHSILPTKETEMDLSALDTTTLADEGVAMEVLGVDGTVLRDEAGNAITIKLLGADSEKVRKRQRMEIDKRLKRGNRAKSSAAEIEENGIDLLVFCTVGWSGVKFNGEEMPCNAENARKLYTALPALRDQVDAFVGDRGNFTKA